jgi:meiotically up-regulated gene 157 (Mug157) protein
MIWEMKWELDSLAAVLKLAYAYYDVTSDDECFTGMGEGDESWLSSLELLLDTMIAEQNGIQEEGECPPYSFVRETGVATDTLQIGADGGGRSVPSKRTGMVKCAFRPSDDTTHLPFLVPANAMAIVELRNVASIMGKIFPNNEKVCFVYFY